MNKLRFRSGQVQLVPLGAFGYILRDLYSSEINEAAFPQVVEQVTQARAAMPQQAPQMPGQVPGQMPDPSQQQGMPQAAPGTEPQPQTVPEQPSAAPGAP